MTTDEPIEARVASILDNTDLVLNKGDDDGVQVGMRFAILSNAREEIYDPVTAELIDSIEIAKTLVKIVRVNPRSSIGRTFRKRESTGIFSALGQRSTHYETLATDEDRVQQELDPNQAKVRRSDVAVEYTGEYTGIVYDF